ncbi:MAG: thiamine diphosphokinase [Coriobacteriia bacterium]|nr:thiamine diphosphokinase [Coriobacteriia bacterium]MCL2750691.1 thiamine diphosphokinase [Coriobacteriia bacterium]
MEKPQEPHNKPQSDALPDTSDAELVLPSLAQLYPPLSLGDLVSETLPLGSFSSLARQGGAEPVKDTVALMVSGSPEGVSPELLRMLVSQTDFVLALDSGAELLEAAGLAPDLLLGDFDSITADSLARLEASGVPVAKHDAYKNATDVELGIEELYARGYRRFIATNVLGGRTDHALGSLAALAEAAHNRGMEVSLRDEREACYFVSGTTTDRALELEFPPDALPSHVSLISWGGPSVVTLKGTEWELERFTLSPYSARGISNELRSPHLHLEVHKGSATMLLLLKT